MTTTLICDCNKTMPLAPTALGAALSESLPLHSALCRREAPAFQKALQSGDDLVVACTQERRLFAELAAQTPPAADARPGTPAPAEAVIRFVNIRETGGWSRDAAAATPKMAALLARARLPEPEPVATVSYASQGRLLIIGALDAAEEAAALLADALDITVLARGPGMSGGPQERRFPVLAGRVGALTGWLGAFRLTLTRDNPIDLDLCTRCNACVVACPEQAIGLDYQIDLDRCASHRDCVAACSVPAAIDFQRESEPLEAGFDLVLDLQPQPAIDWHAPPQGYFHVPGGVAQADGGLRAVLRLRELVGEFEKPKFFDYRQKLCAHSRNEVVGCRACIDVCSAHAVESDLARQRVVVNPNLCVGCGACTTVCPTGALGYTYPRTPDQGRQLRTLLGSYAAAGGRDATLLLHSQEEGAALVEALGRQARLGRAHGVPAEVIPHPLWHAASTGIDLWLSAIAFGAAKVGVLLTGVEAPVYVDALRRQMDIAQRLLEGLGYQGRHFHLIEAATPRALDVALADLRGAPAQVPGVAPARYAVAAEKRSTLELALDHLMAAAPLREAAAPPAAVALPAGAPLGAIAVDRDACTLCLACVSACPASALQDNPQAPQLRFIEKNCVQCGLCATTCPEDAISLVPRLNLQPARRQAVVLNEVEPFACVRCGKAFGTHKAVEAMLARLSGHSMFQGEALERLKMCGDCRVIDVFT